MENNLAAVRYELNLSLRELAKKSGVSWTYISKIESGERTPTVPIAYAICRAVGKSIYEIFPDHSGK